MSNPIETQGKNQEGKLGGTQGGKLGDKERKGGGEETGKTPKLTKNNESTFAITRLVELPTFCIAGVQMPSIQTLWLPEAPSFTRATWCQPTLSLLLQGMSTIKRIGPKRECVYY